MELGLILINIASDVGQSWIDGIFEFASDNPFLILFFSFVLPMLESFIPIVPLMGLVWAADTLIASIFPGSIIFSKFLTITVVSAGHIIGSVLMYSLIKTLFKERLDRKFHNSPKYKGISSFVANANTFVATMMLSLVIVPISLFNIAFALSDVKFHKYLTIQIASRVIMVSYVAILGDMIIDIKNDPFLGIMAIALFTVIVIVGYLVSKKLDND